jgi:hypothetical protein
MMNLSDSHWETYPGGGFESVAFPTRRFFSTSTIANINIAELGSTEGYK